MEFAVLAQKVAKIAPRKPSRFFLVFANKSTVHSGGVSRGGSVAVAVGISDMCHVTRDYKVSPVDFRLHLNSQ